MTSRLFSFVVLGGLLVDFGRVGAFGDDALLSHRVLFVSAVLLWYRWHRGLAHTHSKLYLRVLLLRYLHSWPCRLFYMDSHSPLGLVNLSSPTRGWTGDILPPPSACYPLLSSCALSFGGHLPTSWLWVLIPRIRISHI